MSRLRLMFTKTSQYLSGHKLENHNSQTLLHKSILQQMNSRQLTVEYK